MNINLIGNGNWSRKIYNLLITKNYQVKIISARKFLSGGLSELSNNYSNEMLWIATRPETQFEIIKQASEYKGKIILEKPIIFQDIYPYKTIIDIYTNLKNLDNIYLSKPWVFSEIWDEFKIMCNEKKIKSIQIWRSGQITHDFIHPSLDWLSHDIFLLLDFFDGDLRFSEKSPIAKEEMLTFEAYIDGINIELTGGKNNLGKIAKWKLIMEDDSEVMIDFIKRVIIQVNRKNINEQLTFKVDNPLQVMLSHYLNQANGTSKKYLNSVLSAQVNMLKGIRIFEKN
jgi:hypothetical protein